MQVKQDKEEADKALAEQKRREEIAQAFFGPGRLADLGHSDWGPEGRVNISPRSGPKEPRN